MRGKILVVDHKTPRPDEDSGSASMFSYLQILSRAGFDVTFAPFNLVRDGRYSAAINRLGIKTLAAPQWPNMHVVIADQTPRMNLLLLYRGPTAASLFDLARRAAPATRILFHPVDLHFLRMQREAALRGDAAAVNEADAMRATELGLVSRADATIVVSQHERQLLRELVPDAVVHQIPILREVPLPLPRETPRPSRWPPWRRHRRDLLFIGGFEHAPNVDAVQWFTREVWPTLLTKGFAQRFVIAGSNAPDAITSLHSRRIRVRGHVRNLAPLFAACRASVAPLRYGAGIKGKIVSSLSHGVPVVATSIAAEGMGLRHDHDVLVADTPEAMAAQIMRFYTNDELWRRVSENGYRTFVERFSLDAGADKVLDVVNGLIATPRR